MNQKTTVILALLFAAAFAYVRFYDVHQPGTRVLAEQSGRVLGKFDRAKVDALVITQNDAKLDLRRDTSRPKDEPGALTRWRMQAPLADRADGVAVDALLAELETLKRDSTVAVAGANADRNKLAPYGLQNPRLRLQISGPPADKDAPNAELLFGNETAVEGKGYVQVAGREEVYVASNSLRKQLEKGVGEFRDHQFTDLAPAEIARLTIKNPTGTLELAKEGDHWRLLKPQAARAGDQKLTELLGRLADLRIASFLPEDKSAAADASSLGFAEPRGTLTLATADTPPRTAELLIGKLVEPGKDKTAAADPAAPATPAPAPPSAPSVYARAAGRPSVLTVPKTVEDFLNLKPEDLRDRQLARVNPDTVDRVRIRAVAGGREFTLSRAKGKEKEWTLRDGNNGPEQPANGAEVERLLARLPAQAVSAFVADAASDLPRYGLDQPALRVAFLSVASETTAESAAGEKPLATLEFGKTENNLVFARLAEEPFIVSVDKAVLDSVPADPLAWQSPEIFKTDAAAVRSLTVKPKDGPEAAFARADANASWKPAGDAGAPPDALKIQSAVNTLARLRAVRWVGATRPEHGLDAAPSAAVTLAFAPGGGKLVIGNRSPEGMWFARVDGRPGAFLLNAPDHAALTAPLLAAPAPTP